MNNFLKDLGSQAVDFFETIVLAFVIFLLMDAFVAQPHKINGNSMLPNFKDGQKIFTQKISYYRHPPQRGDVIVFHPPPFPRKEYIKRIIGLPGEKLELKNGQVLIFNTQFPQGFVLKEGYLPTGLKTEGKSVIADNQIYKIPEGEYVTFGDNRNESSDSREWGTVPRANIIGKVFLRYWPPGSLSLIGGFNYSSP